MKKGVESVDLLAESFGAILRELRHDQGMTLEVLGEESGLHPEHIGRLERGVRKPTLDSVFKLATALALPPEELVARVRKRLTK